MKSFRSPRPAMALSFMATMASIEATLTPFHKSYESQSSPLHNSLDQPFFMFNRIDIFYVNIPKETLILDRDHFNALQSKVVCLTLLYHKLGITGCSCQITRATIVIVASLCHCKSDHPANVRHDGKDSAFKALFVAGLHPVFLKKVWAI